jgi:hypothetical protein
LTFTSFARRFKGPSKALQHSKTFSQQFSSFGRGRMTGHRSNAPLDYLFAQLMVLAVKQRKRMTNLLVQNTFRVVMFGPAKTLAPPLLETVNESGNQLEPTIYVPT